MAEVLRRPLDTMDPLPSSLSPSTAASADDARTSSQATTYPASSLSHTERAATTVAGDGVNSRPPSQHDPSLLNSQVSKIPTSSLPGLLLRISTAAVQSNDADLASPTSPERVNSISTQAIEARRVQIQRPHTPGVGNSSKDTSSEQVSSTSTSPMSVDTPHLNKGSKRTASGAIKSSVKVQSATETASNQGAASPREIAQHLKTRLSYAMLKVQNGWENHSLDELEAMTPPPTPARSRAGTGVSQSSNMFAETSDRPLHPTSTIQTNHMPRLLRDLSSPDWIRHTPAALTPIANGRSLAPAAPISSRSHRRPVWTKSPPMLSAANIPRSNAEQPTTPQRHGILRIPSGQAERDAVDTLIFMSSPNNSANIGSAAGSPLKSEFSGVKKVMFESTNGGMPGS